MINRKKFKRSNYSCITCMEAIGEAIFARKANTHKSLCDILDYIFCTTLLFKLIVKMCWLNCHIKLSSRHQLQLKSNKNILLQQHATIR